MSNGHGFKDAKDLMQSELSIVARAIGFNYDSEDARIQANHQYRQMIQERHKPAVHRELVRINDLFLIERLKGKT